jgi:hypothetical protein
MAYFGTTTPLGAAGTVTLGPSNTDRADNISGLIWADQAGTLFVEHSGDGVNWDLSTSIAVVASTGKAFNEPLYTPFVRLRYVNGGVAQGAFRVNARYTSAGDS